MSRPSQPSGTASYGVTCVSASSVEVGGGDDVLGKLDLEVERILVPELLGHLAADDHDVRPAAEVARERRACPSTLAPPATSDERALDVAEQPAEVLELVLEQQAGVRGQDVRDALRGRVRAMRRAERVVHVEVHPLRELRSRAAGRSPSPARRSACSRARVSRSSGSSARSRWAHGAIEKSGSTPSGRPRWEQTTTSAASWSSSQTSVWSEARMRVSSATWPFSSGTLRSARTRTCLPATSASRTDRGRRLSAPYRGQRAGHPLDEIRQAAAVAPLVVVPAEAP